MTHVYYVDGVVSARRILIFFFVGNPRVTRACTLRRVTDIIEPDANGSPGVL